MISGQHKEDLIVISYFWSKQVILHYKDIFDHFRDIWQNHLLPFSKIPRFHLRKRVLRTIFILWPQINLSTLPDLLHRIRRGHLNRHLPFLHNTCIFIPTFRRSDSWWLPWKIQDYFIQCVHKVVPNYLNLVSFGQFQKSFRPKKTEIYKINFSARPSGSFHWPILKTDRFWLPKVQKKPNFWRRTQFFERNVSFLHLRGWRRSTSVRCAPIFNTRRRKFQNDECCFHDHRASNYCFWYGWNQALCFKFRWRSIWSWWQ